LIKLIGKLLQRKCHKEKVAELVGQGVMQDICELLVGRPEFLGTDPLLPHCLPYIPSVRGKMEEAIYTALLLPLLGCL